MVIALIGNQNSGKTTLFNRMTGNNQHVGNFPGVTVEQKRGIIKNNPDYVLVDLPGIYSMSPYSTEEIVTRDFLFSGETNAIINIVDANNIERNLYLTLQLLDLRIPMVIAVNMMDEFADGGNSLDAEILSEILGVPVVPISAHKNDGVAELTDIALSIASKKRLPKWVDFCTGPIHRGIHSLTHIIEDHAERIGAPAKFAAAKLIEGDEPLMSALKLSDNEKDMVLNIMREIESEIGSRSDEALADMRYTFIEKTCEVTVKKKGVSSERKRSEKIDALLTNKYLALPVFFGIMLLIFYLTFEVIGKFLSDILSFDIQYITKIVSDLLLKMEINSVVHSLIIDGIFAGVGSVISFLPIIVVLFFFLSLLEDSGYMTRIAFVMDKPLRKIGLSGRSIVPMLIGFGCSVPAIMATRTLGSERDRKMTILLVPFMSCSAKLPIYGVFTAAFFPKNAALVMMLLYVFGIIMGLLSAIILKNTLYKGKSVPFVMEMPPYRFPYMKSVFLLIWQRTKDFLVKAFTVIFVASIAIWFLRTFDIRLNIAAESDSMLAGIGRLLFPPFRLLGFQDYRISTALITGFSAKEAVISSLAILFNTGEENLVAVLQGVFSPISAFSFLLFSLLYTPCVAAIAAIKRELGSSLKALYVAVFQTGLAFIISALFYQIASALM